MSDPFLHDPSDVDPDVARRLTAAFGALAQAEVPASAPRPAAAPRSATRGGGSNRRRWGIAGGGLLVAAAAVVLALLLGTEVFDARVATTGPPATQVAPSDAAPTTATTMPPTAASSPVAPMTSSTAPRTAATPGLAAVNDAFATATTYTRSPFVAVPGGWEGTDIVSGTVIRFWTSTDGTTWSLSGTSSFPPVFGGGQPASIKAAGLPTGARHAVFVVSDQYATGDGTGEDAAYTDGPSGFGVVRAGPDGDLHPSGQGAPALGDLGLSFREDFQGGLLVTTDCSSTSPDDASCGDATYQVTKYWAWNGDAFVLDHRTGPLS